MPAASVPHAPGRHRADVVIIGAGLAGLYAAVMLPESLDVVIVDKGPADSRSGSSSWAQGGLAAALGPDDSPDLHAADTIRAGDGLVDRTVATIVARDAPTRIEHLLSLGAHFDTRDGLSPDHPDHLHLAREGGQTAARSVHAADATGAELIRVVRDAARPRVQRLVGHAARLARDGDGPVTGVWVLEPDGTLAIIEARAVLLATGGCGALFDATTNQDGATGDGVALAHLAGAAVRDMEFIQFHPTGLAVDGHWRFLLTEALRGAGATLHAADGTRFLVDRHTDAELAPRHIVAGAILDQPDGIAWLDATHLGEHTLATEFPTVLAGARQHGWDLLTQRVPVTPAAHYMVGGVRTDLWGRTSLPGLYAAGEVASTGLHGANRMAGNSLTEALVFGARAAESMANELPPPGAPGATPVLDTVPVTDPPVVLHRDLRRLVSRGAGPVRDEAGLRQLATDLQALAARMGTELDDPGIHTDPRITRLRQAAHTAELIRVNALARPESRGGHARTDRPGKDPAWGELHLERVRGAG
jgi:L-aspartate oxidase